MVSKKHGGNTDTDIICKNFLDALENNKYGEKEDRNIDDVDPFI